MHPGEVICSALSVMRVCVLYGDNYIDVYLYAMYVHLSSHTRTYSNSEFIRSMVSQNTGRYGCVNIPFVHHTFSPVRPSRSVWHIQGEVCPA